MFVLKDKVLQKDIGLKFFLLGSHKEQQLTYTTLCKLFILQDVQSLFSCHTEGTLVNVAAFVRMSQLQVRL